MVFSPPSTNYELSCRVYIDTALGPPPFALLPSLTGNPLHHTSNGMHTTTARRRRLDPEP